LDVARMNGLLKERFEHLNNLTVGEYFAKHIISNIVERINTSFDISKLNMHLKTLANEGKKAAKEKPAKKQCKECKKDVKHAKILKCNSCCESTHFNCLTTGISVESKKIMLRNNDFRCGACRVYPNQIVVADDDDKSIENIESIKLNYHLLPKKVSHRLHSH
jgi:hypothetical protein